MKSHLLSTGSQIIKLKDGRVLGFAEYGDPTGIPTFFFHGWPSSRKAAEKYDALAKNVHIRILSPDRPGYGLSTYQTHRTLLDWPDDVLKLADYLKIKRFNIIGISGGGPYAAVCAYKIPQRLQRVAIVVGLGPIVDAHSFDSVMWTAKIGWQNYHRFPFLRMSATIFQYLNAKYGLHLGLHRYFFGAKRDRSLYKNKAVRDSVMENYREAFRQGYRGPDLDLKLYTDNWGFFVHDIKLPISLWYGENDQNVSLNMARYYHSQIRGSMLTIYPGEGHLISVSHAPEIFTYLASF